MLKGYPEIARIVMREAQWKNKNITELYMPGSVFKLITASLGRPGLRSDMSADRPSAAAADRGERRPSNEHLPLCQRRGPL